MAWSDNEGNVVKQLGRSLNMIRLNVEQEDVRGLANHTRLLVAICAPYVNDRGVYALPRDVDDEADVMEKCMEVVESLLIEMSTRGIYAWKEEAPGDASGLALGDDDG